MEGLWSNSRLQKVTDGIDFDGSFVFISENKITPLANTHVDAEMSNEQR